MTNRSQGFTLVELVVVVAIVGILAGIALPSYNSSIMKGRRTDGRLTLLALAQAQEKFRANCSVYAAALTSADSCGTTSAIAFASTSANALYDIAVTSADATGFAATATAKPGSPQVNDTGCSTLTLTQRQGTLTTLPAGCW